MTPRITAEELLARLSYDPETGEFQRLRSSGTAKAGDIAGWLDTSTGYRKISVLSKPVYAHHLAWLYVHGEWPPDGTEMDHRNHQRSDNRICNLRIATKHQNRMHKSHRPGRGAKGVTWDGFNKKWRAKINAPDGKTKCLGRYGTQEEAALAYNKAAAVYHGEFSTLNVLGEPNV